MPLPHRPAGYAVPGLLLAALVLASAAAPSSRDERRPAIVAAGAAAASATLLAGSWRTELQWLLPGDADPAISPNGRLVAFSSARTGSREIYVADAERGDVRRLTARPRFDDRRPVWSPDGRRLAWQSGTRGRADLFVMRVDGTNKRMLVGGPGDDVDPAWSPDGERIAFASDRAGTGFDLWAVPARGGQVELLLDVVGAARAPSFSPDGERLAYSGTVGRTTRIWLVTLATVQTRRMTRSSATDLRPDWSPDGSRLAFTRVAGGRTRTWTVRVARSGARPRPIPGTEGDIDPDWALATPLVAPGPDRLLPDLDQRAPSELLVLARAGGFHLGFASAVESVGRGPLVIRGWRAPDRRVMRADQAIELRGGGERLVRGVGTLLYQAHPPHRHWHFQQFESYELRRASDHSLITRDRKSGFCLIDRYGRAARRVATLRPPRFLSDCGAGQRHLRRVEQGSSPGYVDRYPAFFHGQDLDVTRVPAGVYTLVHRANPTRRVREAVYSDNVASVRLRLTWPSGRAAPPRVAVLRRCEQTEHCPAKPS